MPTWLPSRVGLGLEQPSTFFTESLNMIMSSWAGDLMKLSVYTGEELFSIAARNAIVGRFGNYPGYYQNRFITFQQKPEYPYIGPDFSSIYWHHIPPFLAMLEDFIFAQAWAWSDRKISFPSVRQQGYAYFNSNQYGHLSGSFFGVEGMWPWLDQGVLTVDNVQIDWLAARKNGMLGIALMNESVEAVMTEIKLGPKSGENYTGTAQLCYRDGEVETVYIQNGKLKVTVAGHTLVGLLVPSKVVREPLFANKRMEQADAASTMVNHAHGKGLIIQLTPESYSGYIYSTLQPKALKRLTLDYRIGNGELRRITTETYPFEFIIEVDNAEKPLRYILTLEKMDGQVIKEEESVLKPL